MERPKVSYVVACVFKCSKSSVRSQDLKMMCAESEQTRRCWTSSFRLFKVFKKLPLSKRFLIILDINIHKVKPRVCCVCVSMGSSFSATTSCPSPRRWCR